MQKKATLEKLICLICNNSAIVWYNDTFIFTLALRVKVLNEFVYFLPHLTTLVIFVLISEIPALNIDY